MTDKAKKSPKKVNGESIIEQLNQQIDELTTDVQRTRADFENYRKRSELEKTQARANGQMATVIKLLPVIDSIQRAIAYAPNDIADHKWVQGIVSLTKQLDTILAGLDLKRIAADPGTTFNPELHEAVQFDEDAEGDKEVIAEELQAGYLLGGQVLRHALVKVTRAK